MQNTYLILSKFLSIFILTMFFSNNLRAQYPWNVTNTPIAPRYEDVFFLNKDTGFAVCGQGKIYKTINGGQSWDSIYYNTGQYIRSIEFSSAKKGFAGSLLSANSNILMKTLDGGNTWINISNLITASNKGICGICSIDTNITYAVGAWSSPAYVIKTMDGGLSWAQINMSAYASRLVDVKFISQNVGYVIGSSNIQNEGGVILKTIDGGLTWNKVWITNNIGDYVWKIQTLDNINWFCSIERGSQSNPNKIIKSIDGGTTWVEKVVANNSAYGLQMIGFINANKGWAGYVDLFQTNDGGDSWFQIPCFQNAFNRFFRVDSSIAYIAGNYVYRYDGGLDHIKETKNIQPEFLKLSVNPNPHSNPLKIDVNVKSRSAYNLKIFDVIGKYVYGCDGVFENGKQFIQVDSYLSKGEYNITIMVNEGVILKKFLID